MYTIYMTESMYSHQSYIHMYLCIYVHIYWRLIHFPICVDEQVNITLPDEKNVEDYIHRVGRVGRAGKMGLAISLVAADSVQEKARSLPRT